MVEDLGSKNGSFIDGQRVRRAAAPSGARLRFGSVELAVERLAGGAELAIRFESPQDGSSSLAGHENDETRPIGAEGSGDDDALAILEGLLPSLLSQDPIEMLHRLAEAFRLDGACLVEWTSSQEPLALTSWGEISDLPPLARIRDLPAQTIAGGDWRCCTFGAGARGLLAARLPGREPPPRRPRGLVLWHGGKERPVVPPRLLRILLRLLESTDVGEELPHQGGSAGGALRFPAGYVTGRSRAMGELYHQMAALCRSRRPVLLHGETGVGKELLARTLHDSSPKAEAPYVVVNCAAIPENLLEAEMFGIVRGAATGIEPRPGYFARADGGTLFLDEIGELTKALQAKLLRTLQENEIQPVGGQPKPVDVWVIAASHVDLFGDGLRRDLYYRLAGGLLEVPPLRRCLDDIPALVDHFLRRAAEEAGVGLRGVTARAVARLRAYSWPGNVRELAQIMYRLVQGCPAGGIVDEDQLPANIRSPAPGPADAEARTETDDLELKPRVEALERSLIIEAMRRAGGRQVKAAEILGVSRGGLAKMLKRLDLKDSWARPEVADVEAV